MQTNTPQLRAINFCGQTPFVLAIIDLYGYIDEIGDWGRPAEHLVHPDDAEPLKALLEAEGIKYGTEPEYIRDALRLA